MLASEERDPHPRAETVFCFLWAAAELFDLACFPDWITHPAGIGLFLAAVSLLLKPSSSTRLLTLCLLDVAYLWVKSPWTPNHFLFKGLVCLSLLTVALRRGRREAFAAEAASILRLELCALYFFSFFHKLNWDFLASSKSCAGFMLAGLSERFPFVPVGGWVDVGAVWGTFLIEGGLPVLLLIPRTRHWGLFLAWGFHFLLSFHPRPGIYAFSAMVFALLSLFLPTDFYAHWERRIVGHPHWPAMRERFLQSGHAWLTTFFLAAAAVTVVSALALWASGVNLRGTNLSEWPRSVGMFVWIPYALVLLAALWIGWPPSAPRPISFQPAYRSPALAVVALVFLNGMAPYLGFQTVRVLSMFSNLRTEGGASNHMLIPVGWQIAGYQTDLVEIVSSSEQVLQFYADARQWIPFAEVRRRIWDSADPTTVKFIRRGRTYSVNTGEPNAAQQVPPLGIFAGKILAFRGINQNGSAECLW
jgi:hypothetical protein